MENRFHNKSNIIVKIILSIVMLTGDTSAMDVAQSASLKPSTHPLTSAQINRSLSGKWIMPASDVKQAAAPFVEYFYADGSWKSVRQSRSLLVKKGSWSVKSAKICVHPVGEKEICRSAWSDGRSNHISIPDFALMNLSKPPVIFEISRISE